MKHLLNKLAHVLNRTAYGGMFPKKEDTYKSCVKKNVQKQAMQVGIASFLMIMHAMPCMWQSNILDHQETANIMDEALVIVWMAWFFILLTLLSMWADQRVNTPWFWMEALANIDSCKIGIFGSIAALMLFGVVFRAGVVTSIVIVSSANISTANISTALGYRMGCAAAIIITVLMVSVSFSIVYYSLSMHIAKHYVN